MRIARTLNEIATVLSQKQYNTSTKLRLLGSYYSLLVTHKLLKRHQNSFHFFSRTIHSSSFTNVVTIVKEVFLFGDYYFKPDTDTPYIIDCGANIGITSLFYGWQYPKATVLALEPSANNAALLQKNISENGLTNRVTILEAAASNSVGEIEFWENDAKPGGSTAVRGVYESKPKDAFTKYRVQSILLSSHIDKPVDLLKIDVEGSEGRIFHDLATSGKMKLIKNMIFEYHQNASNKDNDLITILKTLEEHGFEYTLFSSEFGVSGEQLIGMKSRHFLIRAKKRA